MKRADVEESSQLRAEMKQLHNEMNQMRVSHQQEIARLEAKQSEEVTRLEAKQTKQTEEVKSLKTEILALRAEQRKGTECATFIRILLYFS